MKRVRFSAALIPILALATSAGAQSISGGGTTVAQPDLSGYAKTADVASTYAPTTALTALAATIPAAIQLPGTFTIATLPAAASNANLRAIVTDTGGGVSVVAADAANGCWRALSPLSRYQTTAADINGSLTYLTNADVVNATGGLTANRVWSLSTTNACKGAVMRVTRSFVAGDTYSLTVNGMNVSNGSSLDLHYDGAAWVTAAATANRLQWAQTCALTTSGSLSLATFTFPQAYPAGTIPQVQCTVQAPAGSTANYNCQANGPPTNTTASFAVNYQPTSGITIGALGAAISVFQAAPTGTCVTMTARQPG